MGFFLISFRRTAFCAVFAFLLTASLYAQTAKRPVVKAPHTPAIKVTQIDIEGLRSLLVPKGKPVLINFWATWCEPCREEFPDLVKLDTVYRGKIDFITVSLDDVADLTGAVPKFLGEMKATMPAYLLSTPDESAAITMVSKDWNGNLPLTIIFTPGGNTGYLRKGKIRYDTVAAEIDKLLGSP